MRDLLRLYDEKMESLISSLCGRIDLTLEDERRLRLFIPITLVALPLLYSMLIISIDQLSLFRSMVILAAAVCQVISLLALRYFPVPRIAFRISVFVLEAYFLFLLCIGGEHGSRLLWILTVPGYAIFLLGTKEGLYWALAGFFSSLVLFIDPYGIFSTYPYPSVVRSRFLITYGVIVLIGIVGESLRERYRLDMDREQRKLEMEVQERLRVEEALRNEVSFRRAVMESAAEGLCVYHGIEQFPYVRFTVWNERMKEITGYELEEINRHGWYQSVYPDPEVRERAMARIEKVRQGDDLRGEEWIITRCDGEKRVVNISASVLQTGSGEIQVLALMHDVTARKQDEEELTQYRDHLEGLVRERTAALLEANDLLLKEVEARQRIERALKESEERFRTLAEAAFEGIGITEHGLIVDLNEQLAAMLGYDRTELIGTSFMDRVALEHRGLVSEAVTEGRLEPCEHVAVRKDGTVFPAEIRARVSDVVGRQLHVAAIRDISERKSTEEELRESEERFRSLVRNSSDIVTVIKADGTAIYHSPSFKRILGYDPEEFIGINSFEFVHRDDVPAVSEIFAAVVREGDALTPFEYRFRHADGSWVHIESIASNHLDDPSIGGVIVNSRDITERKHAENALRESEEKFRALVETSSDWIWEVDADGVYTYCSPKVREFLGYDPHEVLGMTPFDFMPHEESIHVGLLYREIVGSAQPFSGLENVNLHKDGHEVILETSGTPVFETDGRLAGYRGVDRDITQRKRAEMALKEANDILNRSPSVAFCWKNEEGCPVEFVTENVESLFGYTGEEFTSRTIPYRQTIHPDDLDRVAEEIATYSAEKERERFSHQPYRIVTKDGEVKWIDDSTYILRNPTGHVTHYQGIVEDVTSRKKAELELAEAQALLLASIEQTPVGILIAAPPDAHIRIANSAALGILGGTVDELINVPVRELADRWQICQSDGKRYVPADLPLVRATLRGETIRDAEMLIRDRADRNRYVIANAAPVRNTVGDIIAGVAVFYDVTERRLAEEERLALERQILHSQKLESLGLLAGGIAHDFNNILTSILGNADLALLRSSPLAPARGNLEEIKRGALRAAGLANQMLAYSGKGKFELTSIDLSSLIREMAQLMQVSISKKVVLT